MKTLILSIVIFALALTACAPSASAEVAGEWQLVSYGDPASLTPAAPDIETTIVFGEDGQVNGNVGCNGFGGDYEVNGDTIVFGQIVSTLMFCEGPVGEQETAVLKVFQESAAYVLDGNTMTITASNGSDLVVLERN